MRSIGHTNKSFILIYQYHQSSTSYIYLITYSTSSTHQINIIYSTSTTSTHQINIIYSIIFNFIQVYNNMYTHLYSTSSTLTYCSPSTHLFNLIFSPVQPHLPPSTHLIYLALTILFVHFTSYPAISTSEWQQ